LNAAIAMLTSATMLSLVYRLFKPHLRRFGITFQLSVIAKTLLNHLTPDRKEIKVFPKLPLTAFYIRKRYNEIPWHVFLEAKCY